MGEPKISALMLFIVNLALILVATAGAESGGHGKEDIREWDGKVVWDDEVAVLNGRNFDEVIRRNAHVLVQFFAPWCGHCQKFEPVYRKAASHLRLEGEEVLLAKIDGPANRNLLHEYGVAGFPSLHWFAYGQERKYEGGRRNDSLVEWVKYHARPDAVTAVASSREAEDFLSRIGAEEAVIGRFPSRHTREARAFLIAAEEDNTRTGNKTIPYVMITEQRGVGVTMLPSRAGEERSDHTVQGPAIGPSLVLRRSAGAGGGSIVFNRWFRPPLWHLNPPDKRYVLFDPDRIAAFVGTYRMPTVVTLSPRTWGKVLKSPVRNQTILFSDPGTQGHEERMAAFEMVGKQMFGRVLFLHIQSNMSNVLEYFGMTAADFPAVVVAVAAHDDLSKGSMFRLDQKAEENDLMRIYKEKERSVNVCKEEQTCSAVTDVAVKMAQIIRRFAFSSFEGKEDVFELPERSLEDDVTYPDDPVQKLTPETFADIVYDPSRDVLVKFFAPWCGHCKAMKTAYMDLHDKLEVHKDVLVAEYDASTHKVPEGLSIEGFPTILLFPAVEGGGERREVGREKGKNGGFQRKVPIAYGRGRREVDDMAAFVERHAGSVKVKRQLEKRVAELEADEKLAMSEGKQVDAAKVREELIELRKELAGHAVAIPGAGEKKNRQPIFGKRILREVLQKQKQEEKARLTAA